MKEIIRENRGKLIVSSLVILLPLLTGWLMLGRVLIQPFFLLAVHWICLWVTFRDQRDRKQSRKAIGLIVWLLPAMSLLFGTISVLAESKMRKYSAVTALVCFGFGVLFLVCGNYFPKIRRNRTMGIKVKWALENEENWNATHRFGGKVWVAAGLLAMICSLFAEYEIAIVLFTVIVLLAAFVPCLYSYLYYRKQVREGSVEKGRRKPGTVIFTLAVVVGVAVFLGWTLFTGDMEIVYGENSFTVETGSWKDLTVEYSEIEDITSEPKDPTDEVSGLRTNGLGTFRVSMGSFENEIYGDYTRYTYAACDSCVVLNVSGKIVVINGENDEATKEIYDTLLEKTGNGK